MRHQKIRGHKRRQKSIEQWRLQNLNRLLNLTDKYNYAYVKINIHPWCDISMIKSEFPEPSGTTKLLMLKGLIDIYNSWKHQLDKIEQPYYLKIWLFETRFSKSQVVCAIGDRIERYENSFFKPNEEKHLKIEKYGHLKNHLNELKWNYHLDEDHIDNDCIGEQSQYLKMSAFLETQKWFPIL